MISPTICGVCPSFTARVVGSSTLIHFWNIWHNFPVARVINLQLALWPSLWPASCLVFLQVCHMLYSKWLHMSNFYCFLSWIMAVKSLNPQMHLPLRQKLLLCALVTRKLTFALSLCFLDDLWFSWLSCKKEEITAHDLRCLWCNLHICKYC